MRIMVIAALLLVGCGPTRAQQACEAAGNEWKRENNSEYKWGLDPADGQYKYRYVIDINYVCYEPR